MSDDMQKISASQSEVAGVDTAFAAGHQQGFKEGYQAAERDYRLPPVGGMASELAGAAAGPTPEQTARGHAVAFVIQHGLAGHPVSSVEDVLACADMIYRYCVRGELPKTD